jgi:hypothetical protein
MKEWTMSDTKVFREAYKDGFEDGFKMARKLLEKEYRTRAINNICGICGRDFSLDKSFSVCDNLRCPYPKPNSLEIKK